MDAQIDLDLVGYGAASGGEHSIFSEQRVGYSFHY
jgi:hypothetical protein